MKYLHFSKSVPYSKYIKFQEKSRKMRKESILFLEHPPTITAGSNFHENNLLMTEEELNQKGVKIFYIKRGGDFTAHEPGQLVIYPHIDLKKRNISVTEFIHIFRNSIAESIDSIWGISVIDNPESPGLYLSDNPEKKIVSFGIYFKSFFTSFGAAVNIDNSLHTFSMIHPCGGKSENITSIQSLGKDTKLKQTFCETIAEDLMKVFTVRK